jgi:TonB family protein
MRVRPPYLTEYRRERERIYVFRMRRAIFAAIVAHVLLFVALAPFKQQLPLVRHIGYEGALRVLPEISVQREVGDVESEQEQAHGRGADALFRVIETRLVSSQLPARDVTEQETEDYDEEYGDELLEVLERALPQPQSRDVVILRLVKPAYPARSIADGKEGVVEFRVHVTKRGRVARAWLLSSEVDREMEESARLALMQWRFRPLLANGAPADFLVDQRIRFRLHDAPVVSPSTWGGR